MTLLVPHQIFTEVGHDNLQADEMTDHEINSELAVIRAQLGYVLQVTKRPEESMKLYQQVLKDK